MFVVRKTENERIRTHIINHLVHRKRKRPPAPMSPRRSSNELANAFAAGKNNRLVHRSVMRSNLGDRLKDFRRKLCPMLCHTQHEILSFSGPSPAMTTIMALPPIPQNSECLSSFRFRAVSKSPTMPLADHRPQEHGWWSAFSRIKKIILSPSMISRTPWNIAFREMKSYAPMQCFDDVCHTLRPCSGWTTQSE